VRGAHVLRRLLDLILFRPARLRRLRRKIETLQTDFSGPFLHVLLKALKLALLVDADFRRDIVPFEATYHFAERDGMMHETAMFHNGRLTVWRRLVGQANARLTFRDSKALADFLFSERPDLLGAMLRQEVTPDGNLNYLYRFAYLANHLRLRFSPA